MKKDPHVAAISPDFTSASTVVYIDSILSLRITNHASLPEFSKFGLFASSRDSCVHPRTILFDMLLTQQPVTAKVALLHSWFEQSTPLQLTIDRQMFSVRIASIVQKYQVQNVFLASIVCKQFDPITLPDLLQQFRQHVIGLIKPKLLSFIPSHWMRS